LNIKSLTIHQEGNSLLTKNQYLASLRVEETGHLFVGPLQLWYKRRKRGNCAGSENHNNIGTGATSVPGTVKLLHQNKKKKKPVKKVAGFT